MSNSYASFDFLFIAEELSVKLGSATVGEVHLFAYLGCLLSLFKGQPVSEWGYGFAGLEAGAPFSPDLQESCAELERAGFVKNTMSQMTVTEIGRQQIEILGDFATLGGRKPYLAAACASLLSFPVGMVRSAMSMEPGLRPVWNVGGMRPLLAITSLEQLHEHFDSLIMAVGQTSDLLVPSTVWLTYLFELSRKHDHTLISGVNR
jgi:hypothetical protein